MRPKTTIKIKIIETELANIRKRYGIITPEQVVSDASRKSHPLHSCFTWDNGEAANLFRLEQARHLIQKVTLKNVELPDAPIQRVYVHVTATETEKRFSGGGYIEVKQALREDDYRAQVLADALEGLQSWMRRYEGLKEFADVVMAIKRLKVK